MKKTKYYLTFVIFFLLFIAFTFLVYTYDVKPVGFENSKLGFSSLNTWFNNAFSSDIVCYKTSEVLGYLALLIALINGLKALFSIKKHTKESIVICFYYALVVAFYILFNIISPNTRPISNEASYPSSHTLLALTVFYSQIVLSNYWPKKFDFLRHIIKALLILLMILMILTRLFSGVHYLTDIIGSVLLSLTLMALLRALMT